MLLGLEIAASARAALRPRIARPTYVFTLRALHASPSTYKKKSLVTSNEAEEDDEFDNTEEEDLFDSPTPPPPSTKTSTSTSTSSPTPSKPIDPRIQLERQALISQLKAAVDLSPQQRVKAVKPFQTRIIREILKRYDAQRDDIKELKSVVRIWRFLGRELTRRAAGEVLAKFYRAGQVEMAVEVLNDPVQYGLVEAVNSVLLHLHLEILRKASKSPSKITLSETTPSETTTSESSPPETATTPPPLPRLPPQTITPTLALANLLVASKVQPETNPKAIVQAMDIGILDDFEQLDVWEQKRAGWVTELEAVGEAWGEAGRDVAGRLGPLVANRVVKTREQRVEENKKRRADRKRK